LEALTLGAGDVFHLQVLAVLRRRLTRRARPIEGLRQLQVVIGAEVGQTGEQLRRVPGSPWLGADGGPQGACGCGRIAFFQ
jgi:hypothetical protein